MSSVRGAIRVLAKIQKGTSARRPGWFGLCVFALLAGGASSCTDPVFDDQIEKLGDEKPGVEPGPLHRPGQPCVLCHSKYGPASDAEFVVGGTVYQSSDPKTGPAAGVEIRIVDSGGSRPNFNPVTNASGNFFVRRSDWSNTPKFPMKVVITSAGKDVAMQSHIGRDGSCAGCHVPPPADRVPGQVIDKYASIPWVHVL